MNELSTISKFIFSSLTSSAYWISDILPAGTQFWEENIPTGVNSTTPQAMFVAVNSDDEKGAFGFRLCSNGLYQIKGVVQGSQYKLIEDIANQIDYVFDWQNQIDPDAGRPRAQEIWTDPDNNSVQIMVMSMLRTKSIKYSTFSDGVNYCHLGGEYSIDYYQIL